MSATLGALAADLGYFMQDSDIWGRRIQNPWSMFHPCVGRRVSACNAIVGVSVLFALSVWLLGSVSRHAVVWRFPFVHMQCCG